MPFFAPAFGAITRSVQRRHAGTRTVVILDNVIPHERRPFDVALMRYFLSRIDGFIAMSRAVADDLRSFYPGADCRLVAHPAFDHLPSHWPPGYPLYLAALPLLIPPIALAALLGQALLYSLNTVLFGLAVYLALRPGSPAREWLALLAGLEHEFGAPTELSPTTWRVARKTDEASTPELRAMQGVAVYGRADGTRYALFESPYWLARVESDHPELTLDKLVAEGTVG